jgi:hypothetical protein
MGHCPAQIEKPLFSLGHPAAHGFDLTQERMPQVVAQDRISHVGAAPLQLRHVED